MTLPGWLAGLLVLVAGLVLVRARSPRGRAGLRGLWLRCVRWEYWPAWAIYGPIVPRLLWRSRRHGGLLTATCVNPPIPLGGLVGESKAEILARFGPREEVARWALVGPGPLEERVAQVERFARELGDPPRLVLKPDRGERGTGVRIARHAREREEALRELAVPVLVQEYARGVEFGVFWFRRPGSARGEVFSITGKAMVHVTGDSIRSVEELILAEARLLPQLEVHLERLAGRLEEIPAAGEEIAVTELGTHALGATFLDANNLRTPELVTALDALMDETGFDFGRFDLRVPDPADLAAGRNLKVIEFNGLSSEATHIYDRRQTLPAARRTLLEQWTLALEVGAANRGAGCAPARWGDVWRALRAHVGDRRKRGG